MASPSPISGTVETQDCSYWVKNGRALQANADIAGIGVIIAFLISACTSLILLASAYWFGALRSDHLSWADITCFGGRYHRSESEWKHTLNRVAFIISDQQLITGLAILIAGFYEMFAKDMDVYHWNIVTYLAYMSSTIHLISLTILRDALQKNSLLRNLRLFGMILLLGLLAAALAPATLTGFRPIHEPGIPARCFFNYSKYSSNHYDNSISYDTPFTYTILSLGYIWKFSSLFTGPLGSKPRLILQTYLLAKPEAFLERTLKRTALLRCRSPISGWVPYHLLKPVFILFRIFHETLRAFATSLTLLLFTLLWGIVHIIRPRMYVLAKNPLPEEWQLSFGQTLPLLLLAQPLAAVIEHCANRKTHALLPLSAALQVKVTDPIFDTPSSFLPSRTLADALKNNDLLTAKEKLDRNIRDPITDHLFSSRSFKGLIWSIVLAELGVMAAMLGIGVMDSWTLFYYFLTGFIFWMPACYIIAMLCTRKLR